MALEVYIKRKVKINRKKERNVGIKKEGRTACRIQRRVNICTVL